MGDIVKLTAPASETTLERERFERWASSAMPFNEATSALARSRGGDYVLATARAGWAAWQARGLMNDTAHAIADYLRPIFADRDLSDLHGPDLFEICMRGGFENAKRKDLEEALRILMAEEAKE